MIQDPKLTAAYLVIDALDECEVGLPDLLGLITRTVPVQSSCIKWIVSSRNRDDIEQCLWQGPLSISSSTDGTMRLWDATTGTLKQTLQVEGYICDITFLPHLIVLISDSNTRCGSGILSPGPGN